jgi:hypothetical protein
MAVRKSLACISLIALAITSQPALAANGADPPTTTPSASPAKRQHKHKHHPARHRRQQQQQAPQSAGAPGSN